MESSNIMSGLPDDYITHPFTSLSKLNIEAERVLERLNQNDDAGNQYILVLNLPRAIRTHLDEDKNVLQGINFRLMFDGTTALIKIVPSHPHEYATSRLRDNITFSAVLAGMSMDDILWSGKTTHRPSVAANKGKEADDCFIPPTRQAGRNQPPGWPSLVIETGVSESLTRLRQDARWWFENSEGAVRTVILLSIKRTCGTILLEKWQLSPPGQPVTPAQAHGHPADDHTANAASRTGTDRQPTSVHSADNYHYTNQRYRKSPHSYSLPGTT
ncbi:hypothetical protein Aspvir_009339 [Aspergillus viridinutans]|uniref:Uncharacterized protein n=1 Tax=Aspergillus viridinutans TaxID=75553 RepID=A0A9P3BZP8_ASPVI|nr:uncharacterized protein Aspvir_009339 [Aspergillus viridinutans]GIK05235.1 hypothetical protein Aspvir_009339 [Aspergillus viridinutans]